MIRCPDGIGITRAGIDSSRASTFPSIIHVIVLPLAVNLRLPIDSSTLLRYGRRFTIAIEFLQFGGKMDERSRRTSNLLCLKIFCFYARAISSANRSYKRWMAPACEHCSLWYTSVENPYLIDDDITNRRRFEKIIIFEMSCIFSIEHAGFEFYIHGANPDRQHLRKVNIATDKFDKCS